MTKRPTITDMLAAVEERAVYHASSAHHFATEYVDPVRHEEHRAKAEAFEAVARTLRIIGTFEDKCRSFFAGLLKEHAQ
jgi:uncharacterized protein with HEPN domain